MSISMFMRSYGRCDRGFYMSNLQGERIGLFCDFKKSRLAKNNQNRFCFGIDG